jgi:LacI family transcriptional regulator
LVESNHDLVGIYVCGGGQDGLIRALRDENVGRQIVSVCNELTPTTRAALIDGTIDLVLAHPSSRMAVKTIELMAKSCGIAELPHLPPVLFSADIYMSENI